MAYATVDDLTQIWRDLSESEQERAAVLLDYAAALLDAEMERCGVSAEDNPTLLVRLRYVSCKMVQRCMVSGDQPDYSQHMVTAGSFSEQFTYTNPVGDMYLTSNERRLLGVSLKRGRAVQTWPWG